MTICTHTYCTVNIEKKNLISRINLYIQYMYLQRNPQHKWRTKSANYNLALWSHPASRQHVDAHTNAYAHSHAHAHSASCGQNPLIITWRNCHILHHGNTDMGLGIGMSLDMGMNYDISMINIY
jgi:hypothetical protein